MADIELRATQFPAAAGVPATTMGLFARLRRALAVRRALHEVRCMDERTLADLGLTREQLTAAVRGRADWR